MTTPDRRAAYAAYTSALEEFQTAYPMPVPVDFVCPHCSAPTGEPCVMRNGRTAPHGSRAVLGIRAAIKWAIDAERAAEAAIETLHDTRSVQRTEHEEKK